MVEYCTLPLDPSSAATSHWLGVVAIVGSLLLFGFVTAWLHARARIERLELELDEAYASYSDLARSLDLPAQRDDA